MGELFHEFYVVRRRMFKVEEECGCIMAHKGCTIALSFAEFKLTT